MYINISIATCQAISYVGSMHICTLCKAGLHRYVVYTLWDITYACGEIYNAEWEEKLDCELLHIVAGVNTPTGRAQKKATR